jgi:hypothetical protein
MKYGLIELNKDVGKLTENLSGIRYVINRRDFNIEHEDYSNCHLYF